jgi:folate-binding Fe-S cluster repair protein YgfZ
MFRRIFARNSSTLSSSSISPAAAAVTASGLYGTLWSRGHETLGVDSRRIVHVHGKGSATFLQGLVTADLLTYSSSGVHSSSSSSNSATPPPPIIPPRCEILTSPNNATDGEDDYTTSNSYRPSFSLLRPACMLDARGRIVTDLLIWNISPEELFLDIPANSTSDVLSHLYQYKVGRSTKSVTIQEADDYSSIHILYGTLHDRNLPPGFLGQLDPRHPSLGLRLLQRSDNTSSAVTQEERHNHLASRIE